MNLRINASRLPSGLITRFALFVLTATVVMMNFGLSFAPASSVSGPAQAEAQLFWAVAVAATGLCAALVLLCLRPYARRRDFGMCSKVDERSDAALKILALAEHMGVRLKSILIDRDISNTDSVVFGFWAKKSIVMGRGLLFLFVKHPADFEARIAHELGHIKNKDVGLTTFSGSLASVVALIGISAFFLGLWRAALRGFQLYTGSPLVDTFDGLTSLYGDVVCSNLAFSSISTYTAETIACWASAFLPLAAISWIILVVEHRGFLRVRELLADSQAAWWSSETAVTVALSRKGRQRRSDKFGALYRPFDAHPSVKKRVEALGNPESPGFPGRIWHAGLGYVIGVVVVFLGGFVSLVKTASPLVSAPLDSPTFFEYLAAVVRSGSFVSVAYFSCSVFVTFLLVFVLLSAVIRQTFDAVLKADYGKFVIGSLLKSCILSLGIIIGSVLGPSGIAFRDGLRLSSPLYQSLQQATVFLLVATAAFSILNFVTLPIARLIIKGDRRRPISSFEWTAFFVLYAYTFLQVTTTVVIVALPDILGAGSIAAAETASILFWTAFYVVLSFGFVLRLRGGMKSSSGFAPWLYSW